MQAQANVDKLNRGNRPEEKAQADAAAEVQRAALEAAKNGARPQELAGAQADLAAVEADAANADATFKRMEMLVRGDTISRLQFDDAKAQAVRPDVDGRKASFVGFVAGHRLER